MKYNVSVSNPMLIGALELMNENPTPQYNKMVSDELVKAEFLSPATITPEPPEGSTELVPGCQISLPILTAPNGKQFFMAYTDMDELKKWSDGDTTQTVSMTFEDYVMMMFRAEAQGKSAGVEGFVVNPYGAKLVVPKEKAKQVVMAKLEKAKGISKPSDQ